MKNYNEIKLELDFLTNSNIRTNSINVPEWEFKKREKEKKTKREIFLYSPKIVMRTQLLTNFWE